MAERSQLSERDDKWKKMAIDEKATIKIRLLQDF